MPSCCDDKQTKREFLEEKLKNFKAFLEPYCSKDEHKKQLSSFQSLEEALPFMNQAAMVRATSEAQLDIQLDAYCSALLGAKDDKAFRVKVGRYVNMFCDLITSA